MHSYTVLFKMNPHSAGSSYRVQLFPDGYHEGGTPTLDLRSIQEVMSALDRCGIQGLEVSEAITNLVKDRSVVFHNLIIEDRHLIFFGWATPLGPEGAVKSDWSNPRCPSWYL